MNVSLKISPLLSLRATDSITAQTLCLINNIFVATLGEMCYWVIIRGNTANFWVTHGGRGQHFFLPVPQFEFIDNILVLPAWFKNTDICLIEKTSEKTAIPAILFLIFLLLPGLHVATKLLLAIQKHIFSCHLEMLSVHDTRPCSWVYSSVRPCCWIHPD